MRIRRGAVPRHLVRRGMFPLIPGHEPLGVVEADMSKSAHQFASRNDHDNAIQMLRLLFPIQEEAKTTDYCRLYIAIKAREKAILACLYLGRLKLTEGKRQEAVQWFAMALEQLPEEELLKAALAASQMGTTESAAQFKELAERLTEILPMLKEKL